MFVLKWNAAEGEEEDTVEDEEDEDDGKICERHIIFDTSDSYFISEVQVSIDNHGKKTR